LMSGLSASQLLRRREMRFRSSNFKVALNYENY